MLPRMSEVSPEQCRFWRDWPNSNFPLWRLSVQTTTGCNATESGGSISPQNRVPQHPMVGLSTILPSKMVIGVWYTPCLDIQLISAFHPQHIPIKKISSTVCLFLMVKSPFGPCWRVFPPSCRHFIIQRSRCQKLVFNGIWICLAGGPGWLALSNYHDVFDA